MCVVKPVTKGKSKKVIFARVNIGLSLSVFKGIMKKGYRVPTPIQRKVHL